MLRHVPVDELREQVGSRMPREKLHGLHRVERVTRQADVREGRVVAQGARLGDDFFKRDVPLVLSIRSGDRGGGFILRVQHVRVQTTLVAASARLVTDRPRGGGRR